MHEFYAKSLLDEIVERTIDVIYLYVIQESLGI